MRKKEESRIALYIRGGTLVLNSRSRSPGAEASTELPAAQIITNMHTFVILAGIVAAASASWNGAPGWGGHGGWSGGGGGWQGPPANVVVQNGQVQDTPEVQAEKQKHFNLVAQASAAAAAAGPDHSGQWNNGGQWDNGNHWNDNQGQWNGDNGQWNGNQGQWNPAPQWNGPAANSWAGHGQWGGSPAKIVVNNGQVQETPEVAAARAQHLAALQAAGAGAHGAHNPHWG